MKKTILVIEDDDSISEVLKVILESDGYNVVINRTGLIENLSTPIDLALVDYLLPSIKGSEVINLLKKEKDFENTKIILMSANTENELLEIAKTIEVDQVIPKPFDMDELLSKINTLLS